MGSNEESPHGLTMRAEVSTGKPNLHFDINADLPPLPPHPLDESYERDLKNFFAGANSMLPLLREAEADRDRYYRIACNGGFGNSPKLENGFFFEDLMGGRR